MESIAALRSLGITIRKLHDGEAVPGFDCGDADLNDFIAGDAANYKRELLAVTYIVLNAEGKVLAYFSLAYDKVSLTEFKDKTEFNKFRKKLFVNSKRLRSYPAAKICRLAVDKSARGFHLGSFVLDLISTTLSKGTSMGCRFLTVDAYLDAIPFYEKNDFRLLSAADEDAEHTRLLFFDLKALIQCEQYFPTEKSKPRFFFA